MIYVNIRVREKTTTVFNQNELDVLSPFTLGAKPQIYKSVSISGQKYTSAKSKELASIDFFIKLKQSTIGIVKFYFVHEFVVYGFMEIYNIINQQDQFSVVKSTGDHEVFRVCNVEKKLLYLKIGSKEIVTSIPNQYEKT